MGGQKIGFVCSSFRCPIPKPSQSRPGIGRNKRKIARTSISFVPHERPDMIPSLGSRHAHGTNAPKGSLGGLRVLLTVGAALFLACLAAACSGTTKPVASPTTHVSNPPAHLVSAPPKYVSNPPTVGIGSGPDGLAFDAATHTLYTTNQNSNSVSVVNTEDCNGKVTSSCTESVSSVPLGANTDPQGVALDADTDTIYVADNGSGNSVNNGNGISVINGATCNAVDRSGCGAPLAKIADTLRPIALAVDQLTDTVYVANGGTVGTGNTVSVVNGSTCDSRQSAGCDQTPATINVGKGPSGIAVDPATDTVYVSDEGVSETGDTVSVFNGATCGATQTSGCRSTPESITVGLAPNWIALDLSNGTAYTANLAGNSVSVIDTATCNATIVSGCSQKTADIQVGANPWALAVDQSLHTLYVANNWDETLSVINTDSCNGTTQSSCSVRPPTVPVGGGPQAVAVDPSTNTVYTANFNDNNVSVTDAASCSAEVSAGCRDQLPEAQVGSAPAGLAVDTATHSLYVADQGTNTISVIDTTGCNASTTHGCSNGMGTVHVGSKPTGVAIDPETHTLYVTDAGGNTVSVVDTSTCNAEVQSGCGQTPPEVTVGTQPFGIALDPVTDTVYVTVLGTNDEGDTVSVIDGATCNGEVQSGCGQTPPEVTVGSGPFGIAVNSTTNTVYVADSGQLFTTAEGHTVSVINGTTCDAVESSGCRRMPTTVTVGRAPYGVAVDDATNTVYVVNNDGGDTPSTISTIDGADCDATEMSGCVSTSSLDLGPGRAPNGVALDPSTDTLYTANYLNATVSAIDIDSPNIQQVAHRFAVGSAPQNVIVDPADHTVYVTNTLDGTVSVLAESAS
jgi:YVTN family beta-propeller protein